MYMPLVCLSHATGVSLFLNGVQYPDNSVVNITDIGTGSAALFCTTTRIGCCLSTDGSNWYFPDGNTVQRNGATYYRTRTVSSAAGGTVRLNRNPEATTTGVFRCDIPGSGGLQSILVGIYTATTGESQVCVAIAYGPYTWGEPNHFCLKRHLK